MSGQRNPVRKVPGSFAHQPFRTTSPLARFVVDKFVLAFMLHSRKGVGLALAEASPEAPEPGIAMHCK